MTHLSIFLYCFIKGSKRPRVHLTEEGKLDLSLRQGTYKTQTYYKRGRGLISSAKKLHIVKVMPAWPKGATHHYQSPGFPTTPVMQPPTPQPPAPLPEPDPEVVNANVYDHGQGDVFFTNKSATIPASPATSPADPARHRQMSHLWHLLQKCC
jgi:hypothetical protein